MSACDVVIALLLPNTMLQQEHPGMSKNLQNCFLGITVLKAGGIKESPTERPSRLAQLPPIHRLTHNRMNFPKYHIDYGKVPITTCGPLPAGKFQTSHPGINAVLRIGLILLFFLITSLTILSSF